MISLDFTQLHPRDAYKIMISAIVPRPIAFVTTISPNGVPNAAPFSFFNGVSSKPPCLVFSVTLRPDGNKKDTLRNIEANGECVVHVASEWIAGAVNHTSGEFPYEIDEIQLTGLTPLPSLKVKPPRIAESPVHFECVTEKLVTVGEGIGSATLVIARIVQAHIRETAYQNGAVTLDQIKPLSRLGGSDYGLTRGVFSLPRPTV